MQVMQCCLGELQDSSSRARCPRTTCGRTSSDRGWVGQQFPVRWCPGACVIPSRMRRLSRSVVAERPCCSDGVPRKANANEAGRCRLCMLLCQQQCTSKMRFTEALCVVDTLKRQVLRSMSFFAGFGEEKIHQSLRGCVCVCVWNPRVVYRAC